MAELPTRQYPDAEHYVSPRTAAEQARDELRLYPNPETFRGDFMPILRRMYSPTLLAQSMQRYASFVGAIEHRTPTDKRRRMNFSFYSGSIVGMHLNIAPLPDIRKYPILKLVPLPSLDEALDPERMQHEAKEWLTTWMSEQNNGLTWRNFMLGQDEDYQGATANMAEILYEGRTNRHKRATDFIAGLALASGVVQDSRYYKHSPGPV